MKTQIISLFIIISTLIFFGCKSGNNDKKTEAESQEHFEGDGHNNDDHEGYTISSDDDAREDVNNSTGETVENESDYAKKARKELAELDDLDI